MAKPLTDASKNTEPKFELTLDKETHIKLIDYLILTNQPTKRNEFINNLIEKALDGKVLDNEFIILDEPFYFNKKELLENKTVQATKLLPLNNLNDIFVVQAIPNNLDDFNHELETYCSDNNKNIHTGYYILPKFKEYKGRDFVFRYDSEKETLEINLVNRNDIDLYFDGNNEEKQIQKDMLLKICYYHETKLANDELTPIEFLYSYYAMYSYKYNKLIREEKEKLTAEEIKEKYPNIYFDGIYL